jgi:stage V sporulation protein D (sporulation-specific penicillin-binding protein)
MRRQAQRPVKRGPERTTIIYLVFVFWGLAIVGRLFVLQVLNHEHYMALAQGQHALSRRLLPKRGEIFAFDRRSKTVSPLAINKQFGWLYASPREIADPHVVAYRLAEIMGFADDVERTASLQQRLMRRQSASVALFRKVTDEQRKEIEAAGIKGLFFINETYRFYPEKQYAAHILGFVGIREDRLIGQYGIEGALESELSGEAGSLKSERDARGRIIAVGKSFVEEATDGSDIVLTIDPNIQHIACKKLEEYGTQFSSKSGSIVVLEPATGAILAMCSYPEYDPNEYNKVSNIAVYQNNATQFSYEPGSVFKPLTMAAAIDAGALTPDTTYEDTGEEKIGSHTIRNATRRGYGVQTMTNVLERSLNTGSIFAMRSATPEVFRAYVEAFGFGRKTGLELPEEAGNIRSLRERSEIFPATASFGQGITVTPLQLAVAYGVIANDGRRMKPYLVKEIIKPDGTRVVTEPTVVEQVISPKTAKTMGAMLVSVIEASDSRRALVPGYYLGGKTGTAQKPGPGGTYGSEIYASFTGYGPMNDPRFSIAIMYDAPKVDWAEAAAAPLFKDVASYILKYYQIPPEKSNQ